MRNSANTCPQFFYLTSTDSVVCSTSRVYPRYRPETGTRRPLTVQLSGARRASKPSLSCDSFRQSGVATLLVLSAPIRVNERRHEYGAAGQVLVHGPLAAGTYMVVAYDLAGHRVGQA